MHRWQVRLCASLVIALILPCFLGMNGLAPLYKLLVATASFDIAHLPVALALYVVYTLIVFALLAAGERGVLKCKGGRKA